MGNKMKSLSWISWMGLFSVLMVLVEPRIVLAGEKHLVLDAREEFQKIDGFGVNITPAQWRKGNLQSAIDLLVDDLGCTLIRFDCYGKADWLDPNRRDSQNKYPEDYLKSVYTNPIFQDAWDTFRYLNSKGIEPFFNISGRIPKEMAGEDGQTLVDYDAYAEMVVGQLQWARDRENLQFHLFSPFNETDLGFPEGPRLEAEGCVPAIRAVLRKMDESRLGDVQLLVMDDANPKMSYWEAILQEPELAPRIAAFGTHCYGNGGDEDGGNWFMEQSGYGKLVDRIRESPFRASRYWLTEYGDLDQTGEVEYGVAWRSTRRLLKRLNDGMSAGIAWDAFDNFHEHDGAWATYGLLQTDRDQWTYTPKRRYYAAKQVYRYVKPGFHRVQISVLEKDRSDVYATWHAPLKHLLLSAFVSPDGSDFTIVGMSTIESDTILHIELKGLAEEISQKNLSYYRTSRNEDCVKIGDIQIERESVQAVVPENCIFTFTTVK